MKKNEYMEDNYRRHIKIGRKKMYTVAVYKLLRPKQYMYDIFFHDM